MTDVAQAGWSEEVRLRFSQLQAELEQAGRPPEVVRLLDVTGMAKVVLMPLELAERCVAALGAMDGWDQDDHPTAVVREAAPLHQLPDGALAKFSLTEAERILVTGHPEPRLNGVYVRPTEQFHRFEFEVTPAADHWTLALPEGSLAPGSMMTPGAVFTFVLEGNQVLPGAVFWRAPCHDEYPPEGSTVPWVFVGEGGMLVYVRWSKPTAGRIIVVWP